MLDGQQIYKAKTHHINNVLSVEFMVNLRFNVFTILNVKLPGIDLPFLQKDDEASCKLSDLARYCLIILIGGKNVLLKIDDDSKRNVSGVVLLKSTCPIEQCNTVYNDEVYINVNEYLKWLSVNGFDAKIVKQHLNKKGV